MSTRREQPATYAALFRSRDFRSLFLAHLASLAGDQVGKIALTLLVFARSHSALLAALAYATSFLPWALGGPVLAAVADRLPRRRVMVGCDLARAGIIALAAVPGVPVPGLLVLMLAASLLAPPFEAARAAVLPEVLTGEDYVLGTSLNALVNQASQLAGFGAGGVLVVVLSARGALLFDAATFLVSAALLVTGLHCRAQPERAGAARPSLLADAAAGARTVFGNRRLRFLVGLSWAGVAFAVVPEALAAPYAAAMHRGPGTVGLLMAAPAAGSAVGALVLGRVVGARTRSRLMLPMAGLSALPLLACITRPSLPVTLSLFAVAGAGGAYQITANTAFSLGVPPAARARAFGLAVSGIQVAQGLGIGLAGAAAVVLPPSTVIALAGVAGLAAVGALALRWPGDVEPVVEPHRVIDLTVLEPLAVR
ncbi:MAG: MFS transporter [Actinomycetota bacterium]|nr:MFS transporter [Actinomycetota bacterium]